MRIHRILYTRPQLLGLWRIINACILGRRRLGTLKKMIKGEKPAFRDIDVDSLDLWWMSEPYRWLHSITLSSTRLESSLLTMVRLR
jgi:hypothetical protein